MENHSVVELAQRKHYLEKKLSEMVYGAVEIRKRDKKQYIYVHYRLNGKQISTYVGEYTDDLYNLIIKNNEKSRKINHALREVKHALNKLNYTEANLPEEVRRNIDFAKRNLSLTIHSQAILEGVTTTFASTEDIIEGAEVSGMSATDIAKILNMKRAWEFILDENVITTKSDLGVMMQINKIIEEGFYYGAGKVRDVPVKIGGTSWTPGLPLVSQIEENLNKIINKRIDNYKRAIKLALYIQKTQIFLDGNKRTAIIFANHFLISRGLGLIYIPAEETEAYKKLLISYYEGNDSAEIEGFLMEKCLLKI